MKNIAKAALPITFMLFLAFSYADACTGIRLKAQDGGVVYGRSMEWGTFDLHSRVAVIPRGFAFQGLTPDGQNGKKWQARYGVVALDMLERDPLTDGINEKGLAVGMFYHPGFAQYSAYDKAKSSQTITALDMVAYILTRYATIDEVKSGLEQVRVVPVVEEAIGIPVFAHWMVTEPSGKSIVIEYLKGKLTFFDNPLGVITNAPSYDWHMTNLKNYLNLSAVALPTKNIEAMDFAPLGGGSGMIGLPGDYTPPSRFVRAVAWTQTARPLPDAGEAVYELFRILDNFNLPLGSAEGSDSAAENLKGMRSSTIWTTAWNLADKKLYFHTQHNRRVRMVDCTKLNFNHKKIVHIALDEKKEQDIKEITFR
nr:choloylglycine hydrolase family protein [uncultured Desulfobacter sp.]